MRKLATVLALSLAATHGLPRPRGSAIAKNEDVDEPPYLRGGISKDVDEAVNSGRKPLMGSITPPGFVGSTRDPLRTFYFNYVDGFVCNGDGDGDGAAIKNNWVCCNPDSNQKCSGDEPDKAGGASINLVLLEGMGYVTKCEFDSEKKRGVVQYFAINDPFWECMAEDFKYGLAQGSGGNSQFFGTMHTNSDTFSPKWLKSSFRISKIQITKGTSKLTLENVHFGFGLHMGPLQGPYICRDWYVGAKTAYNAKMLKEECSQDDHNLYFCQSSGDSYVSDGGAGESRVSDLRLSRAPCNSESCGEPGYCCDWSGKTSCNSVNVDYTKWCASSKQVDPKVTIPWEVIVDCNLRS